MLFRLGELRRIIRQYRHNYYTRRHLMKLDHHALKDIGVSRAEAISEGRKPFWRTDIKSAEMLPQNGSTKQTSKWIAGTGVLSGFTVIALILSDFV